MIRIFKDTNFDFVGKRYIAFIISSILLVVSFAGLYQIFQGKANMGIDFIGGALISIKFEKPVTIEQVRQTLAKGNVPEGSIQKIPKENKFLIRIKSSELEIDKVVNDVKNIFIKNLPGHPFIVDRSEVVGPAVGKELQKKAFWAVFWVMIAITAYISLRFEFQFGIAAAIATLHDVLCIIGVFYLLDKEFSLLILSALLITAGYSLNDTIVVFDRIRENIKLHQKETLTEIFNLSLNEVLNRTIITSITTLIPVIALLIYGGEVIHDFAFAVMIGIIVGTYSSCFVASPVIIEWKNRTSKKR